MLNRLRMRHVRCFLAVARTGSVTAAAEEMNSSQPAVSRSLGELEALIEKPLFVRTGRGLALSEAGKTLHRHLDMAFSQIEVGTALAKGDRPRPRVSLGMLPNVARSLAVDTAGTFKEEMPDTDLSIHWASVDELRERILRNDIDLLLGRLLSIDQMEGMSFEQLYTENLMFVTHHSHPLAQRAGAVEPHDLLGEMMIVPLLGTIIRKEMDKFLAARGITRFERQVESVSFEFFRRFIIENQSVACAPLGAVRQELEAGTLVDLGIEGEELVGSVGITTLADRELPTEAKIFIDHARAAAQKYI